MVNLYWFRRDLRLEDNAGLYYALKSQYPVVCIFIFDKTILKNLSPRDSRVSFIYEEILKIKKQLETKGSSLVIFHDEPKKCWPQILKQYPVHTVFANHDYEPQARKRDFEIKKLLEKEGVNFKTFKDQVIFETKEILTSMNKPYTVYTPYANKWLETLTPIYLKPYPNKKYFKNFYKMLPSSELSLQDLGFKKSSILIPKLLLDESILLDYA